MRVSGRGSTHVPAIPVPARVHSPEDTPWTAHKEDVRVAACEKRPCFAFSLRLKQSEDVRERGFVAFSQDRNDGRVRRVLHDPIRTEMHSRNISLSVAKETLPDFCYTKPWLGITEIAPPLHSG